MLGFRYYWENILMAVISFRLNGLAEYRTAHPE
jgi:hypothetical protein